MTLVLQPHKDLEISRSRPSFYGKLLPQVFWAGGARGSGGVQSAGVGIPQHPEASPQAISPVRGALFQTFRTDH